MTRVRGFAIKHLRGSTCSTPCKTAWPRRSRACAARAGSPRPTSTRPRGRSGSRLLEADVAWPWSRTSSPPSRSGPGPPSSPARSTRRQQIIKIVNEELVNILGGETRLIRFAKRPPTVIMLAGLQGAGKTTLAGKLALLAEGPGSLAAPGRRRPAAAQRGQPAPGRRSAGRASRSSPRSPATGVGDPVAVARESMAEAERKLYDVVIVDTAGRLGVDAELMQQAATSATRSTRTRSCSSSTR